MFASSSSLHENASAAFTQCSSPALLHQNTGRARATQTPQHDHVVVSKDSADLQLLCCVLCHGWSCFENTAMRRLKTKLFTLFTSCCFYDSGRCLQAPVEVLRPTAPPDLSLLSLSTGRSSSWIGASSIHLTKITKACSDYIDCNEDAVAVSTHVSSELFKTWKKDKVVRIVDANTIKLEKQGLVTLAGMQMPSPSSANFQFPDCFDRSPSFKLRKLLPSGTTVRVQPVSPSSSGSSSNALLVRQEDGTLVNAALVEAGFGRYKEKSARKAESFVPNFTTTLAALQQQAQNSHAGMYQSCDASTANTVDYRQGNTAITATFEPLQPEPPTVIPPNPGDRRNCADFETYEDALKYYETFYPYYGDVARLDRDNDGVPCPGLAHTKNPELYRMKVPKDRQGMTKVETP